MNVYDSQPSGGFVPATFVVVGRGSSSTITSDSDSDSETFTKVTGGEDATSITGSAVGGGSWVSVVCGSEGLSFLANASAMVGFVEAGIWN